MTTVANSQPSAPPPEFYRLPKSGPDCYFGLTRSHLYNLEKSGAIRLVRIRERGKLRGITLVPYDAVRKFILSQVEAAPAEKGAA